MAIKFGLFPLTKSPPRGENLDRLFAEICAEMQLAEEVGFDSCLLAEHHQNPEGQFPAPLIAAAGIAARTKRLRIGPGVLLLPLQHAIHVAEDAAMLDVISAGRLILALGIGYQPADFAAFGVPMSHRVSLFEEGIEVIKRAWTEDRFSFHGKRYSLENVSLQPKPLQQPRPPIWLGSWTMEGVKRAGRVADAWLADPIQARSAVQAMAAVYRDTAAKRGRPSSVVLMREGWVAESRARALAEYGEPIMIQHRYYWRNKAYIEEFDPWLKDVKTDADLTLERIADRLILGSPEECVDQIARWHADLGMDALILRIRHATGPSHERVMQAIKLFGEKVIPRFA